MSASRKIKSGVKRKQARKHVSKKRVSRARGKRDTLVKRSVKKKRSLRHARTTNKPKESDVHKLPRNKVILDQQTEINNESLIEDEKNNTVVVADSLVKSLL